MPKCFGRKDLLGGDRGSDFVGRGGNDRISAGKDTMNGLQGDDTLIGDILNFSFGVTDGDTAIGGQGTDVCDAETETECETDPPAARRRPTYARYAKRAYW